MQEARQKFSLAVMDDCMFALGGTDESGLCSVILSSTPTPAPPYPSCDQQGAPLITSTNTSQVSLPWCTLHPPVSLLPPSNPLFTPPSYPFCIPSSHPSLLSALSPLSPLSSHPSLLSFSPLPLSLAYIHVSTCTCFIVVVSYSYEVYSFANNEWKKFDCPHSFHNTSRQALVSYRDSIYVTGGVSIFRLQLGSYDSMWNALIFPIPSFVAIFTSVWPAL